MKSRSGKKSSFRQKLLYVAVAACFSGQPVYANPVGGQVVRGSASISQQGGVMTVVNTPGTIVNWQNFSIGTGETTRFVQQSTSSAILNRVVGVDPSSILGNLTSNGRVYLINPNGILFGAGSRIDTAGFVASTLNLSDQDFINGRNNFSSGAAAGKITNQGNISTTAGGSVYLVAPDIENSGIITSPNGEIILAAGKTVELVDTANPSLRVKYTAPEGQAVNMGQIIAEGGKAGIYAGLISQRGTVSASSAVAQGGKIYFKATQSASLGAGSQTTASGTSGGSVTVQTVEGDTLIDSASVNASGIAGKGGNVQLLGNRVGLTGATSVDASGKTGGGSVLVGGDYQGKNTAVQNASMTYFGQDASLNASATDNGDGGKVIVWADDTARAYGSITAQGGANGGDGGLIETSGHRYLDVAGIRVSTSASTGNYGLWLLDPSDITITHSPTNPVTPFGGTFNPGGATGTVSDFDINLNLNGGTNVLIKTAAGTGGAGNIVINGTADGGGAAIIQNSSGGTRTLTMQADGGINMHIGAFINGTAGNPLNVNLDAAGGNIIIDGFIVSEGGGITLTTTGAGHNIVTTALDSRRNDGSANSGDVTINASGNVDVSSIQANGLNSFSGNGFNGGNVDITGNTVVVGTIVTNGGDGYSPISSNGGNAGNVSLLAKDNPSAGFPLTFSTIQAIGGAGGSVFPSNPGVGGTVNIRADAIDQNVADIQAPFVTIRPNSDRNIKLGAASWCSGSSACDLDLAASLLDIVDVKKLEIGDASLAGSITLVGDVNLKPAAGGMDLALFTAASGKIDDGGFSFNNISVANFRLISLLASSGSVWLNGGSHDFDTITGNATATAAAGNIGDFRVSLFSTYYNQTVVADNAGRIPGLTGGIEAQGNVEISTVETLRVDSPVKALGGGITVNGDTSVEINNDAQFIFGGLVASAGSVTINSLGNIEISGEAKSQTGGVYATSTNGNIYINNFNGDGTFNGSILAAAPDPTIDSVNAIKLDATHVIVNHSFAFASPPIPLGTPIVTATSGNIALPMTGATLISLGTADLFASGPYTFNATAYNSGLTNAQLAEFSLGAANAKLKIGNGLSDIIVDNAINVGSKNLVLNGSKVIQAHGQSYVDTFAQTLVLGSGSIVANGLELDAPSGFVDLSASGNQASLLSGTASSDFSYSQAANLTVGQQTTGIVAGGNIDVRSTAGKLTVLQSVDAGNTNLSGSVLLAGATGVDASGLPSSGFINAGQFGSLDILATNDGGATQTTGNILLGSAASNTFSGGEVKIATNGNVAIVGNVTMDSYGGGIFAGGTLSVGGNIVSNGTVTLGASYGVELAAGGNIALGGNIFNNHTALSNVRIASTGGNIDLNNSGVATSIKTTRPGIMYLLAPSGQIGSTNQQVVLDTKSLVAKAANGITVKTMDLEQLAAGNSASGNISVKDAFSADNNPLAITTIGPDTGVASVGNVVITSDRTVQLDSIISAGGSIDVVGSKFINLAGAGALTAGGGWHVWSTNPDPFNVTSSGDVQGGLLYNFKQYNATYGVTPVLGAGNGFLYTFAPTITPTLSGTVSKIYDGTNIATLTPSNFIFTGTAGGDTVTFGAPASTTYADKNVGAGKPVNASGLSFSAANGSATVYGYQLSSPSVSANIGTISAASLNLNAVTDSKTYDGTTASAGVLNIVGLMPGDTITGANQVFNSKNVAGAGLSTLSVASGYTVNDGNGGSNYLVTSTNATGTITPATLTVAATGINRTYDGTTSSAITLGDNRFVGDVLTLNYTSANFVDKNVATGKTVNISGITMAGTDAGNYSLASSTGSTTADITVRPVSTWLGGTSGVWSAAANWDALPDLSNVQTVSIPTGVTVTYDLAAPTNLQSLSSAGSLAVGSGTLSVGNQLSTVGYTQTGGAVNAGSFVASNSFSQTGGTLAVTGSAAITQTSGNLLLGNFSAGNAALAALSGAIIGTNLQVSGISAGATGNINLTNVGSLNIGGMQSSGGNILIDNTGGVVTGTQTVTASNGSVQFIAHSPITIGSGGISASGNINLSAGQTNTATLVDNITLNGALTSSGGNIALNAADNITQNANITTSGGSIGLNATTGGITMAANTTTNSGGGAINYSANKNILLATVNAGSGNVNLTSTNGSLTSQPGGSITGSGVSLTAKTGIKLTTNAQSLSVNNTGPDGTVFIIDGATGTVFTDVPAPTDSADPTLSELPQIPPGEDSTDLGLPGTDDQTIGKKKENEEENGGSTNGNEEKEKKSDKKNAC